MPVNPALPRTVLFTVGGSQGLRRDLRELDQAMEQGKLEEKKEGEAKAVQDLVAAEARRQMLVELKQMCQDKDDSYRDSMKHSAAERALLIAGVERVKSTCTSEVHARFRHRASFGGPVHASGRGFV